MSAPRLKLKAEEDLAAFESSKTVRVLTVAMNPTLDVATRVGRLINHQKLRCESEIEQVGGGGINVAQVMQSLGSDCTAAFTSGGWRGQEIRSRLLGDGINCLELPIAQESRQCFTVYETSTGSEYRFILPGPVLSGQEWEDSLDTISQAASRFDWLIASGSLPPGVPEDYYSHLLDKVRDCNVRTVIDTSGQPLAQALKAGVEIAKPSREELAQLLQRPLTTWSDCMQACQSMLDHFPVKIVALSLGGEGALVCTPTNHFRVEPLAVEVTSTVGAGDSFVGGLVWSLSQGADLAQAARVATAAAAAALRTQGKLRFDRQEILAESKNVVVTPA